MQLPVIDLLSHRQLNEAHRQMGQALRPWVDEQITPYAAQWDEAGEFPQTVRDQAADLGLLGLGFAAEFGGTPCDMVGRIVAANELCRAGLGGLNASLMSHTIMVWPLIAAGHPALCGPILQKIFSGKAVGALAITEVDGGSDVAQLKTRATRTDQGWSITGSKMYITSGIKADYILVAARTGAGGAGGLSLFLVPGTTPGLQRQLLHKTGWWCSDTAALYFDGCTVPDQHLIGEVDQGFRLIMRNFNSERLLMAAASLSFASVCIEEAWQWACQRRTFGKALIEHQVIRQKIIGLIEQVLPLQSWLLDIGHRCDSNEEPAGEIALLKNACGKVMRSCADEAIQILGASGYMRGSRSERIYREVKVMMVGGGANEILNDLAAKQLGLL